MIKASFLFSILATVLTLPLSAQLIGVQVPDNGDNCSHQDLIDKTPWVPPGEPTSAHHFAWDNGDWISISYSYYEYDNGKISAHVIANEDNELLYRIEYIYDAQGQLIEENKYDYSPGPTSWILKSRSLTTYDSQGRYIERLGQHYGFGQWYNSGLRSREYDAHNFQTLELSREWNDQTNFWDTSYAYQTNFTYDVNGYPSESIGRYQFNGSAWQNVERLKYVLDASNEVIEIRVDGWNGAAYVQQELHSNIVWMNNPKRTYESVEYHVFDGVNYVPTFRTSSVVNGCQRNMMFDGEYWDGTGFTYISTTGFEYDTDGTYLGIHTTYVDTPTTNLITDIYSLGTPTYDGSGAIQTYIYQEVDSTNTLQNETMSIYDYATGIEEANANHAINLYPSPANDVVNINFYGATIEGFQLFNTTGQLIETHSATTRQIRTINLPNGVYFIVATTASGAQIQEKFVVQH